MLQTFRKPKDGLNPSHNPAIRILHFADVLQRFQAAALLVPQAVRLSRQGVPVSNVTVADQYIALTRMALTLAHSVEVRGVST